MLNWNYLLRTVRPNYLVYVNTLLFYRVGGTTRTAGFLLALATLALLVVGTEPIGYIRTSLSSIHAQFVLLKKQTLCFFRMHLPFHIHISYSSYYACRCAHIRARDRPCQRGSLGYPKTRQQVRVPHHREHHDLYDTLGLCYWSVVWDCRLLWVFFHLGNWRYLCFYWPSEQRLTALTCTCTCRLFLRCSELA